MTPFKNMPSTWKKSCHTFSITKALNKSLQVVSSKDLKTKIQGSQMDISKDQNTSFSKEHAISMPYKSYPTGFVYLFFQTLPITSTILFKTNVTLNIYRLTRWPCL